MGLAARNLGYSPKRPVDPSCACAAQFPSFEFSIASVSALDPQALNCRSDSGSHVIES
jgi:hypothetical protein